MIHLMLYVTKLYATYIISSVCSIGLERDRETEKVRSPLGADPFPPLIYGIIGNPIVFFNRSTPVLQVGSWISNFNRNVVNNEEAKKPFIYLFLLFM